MLSQRDVVSEKAWRFRTAAVVGLTALLVLSNSPGAHAFWRAEPSCAARSETKYGFSTDPEWTDEYKAELDAAFGQWTQPGVLKDIDGTSLYTWGGDGFTVRWATLGYATHARTVCGGFNVRNIEFNRQRKMDFDLGLIDFTAVATHEWGHAWGLHHSGMGDSEDGSVPTMATCLTEAERVGVDRSTTEQDDHAAASFRTDVVNLWATGTANQSFEHGQRYWSGNSFSTSTGGAAAGGRKASVGDIVTQRVPVVEGWNTAFRTSVSHKNPSTGGPDYFYLTGTFVENIDYADALPGSYSEGSHASNADGVPQDMNERQLTWNGWAAPIKVCYPSSSWQTCTSAHMGDISSTSGPDGKIIRFQIHNPFTGKPVHIDLARLQLRPLE